MISGQLEELEEEVWLIMVTSSNRTYLIVELVVELALQTIHSTVYMQSNVFTVIQLRLLLWFATESVWHMCPAS